MPDLFFILIQNLKRKLRVKGTGNRTALGVEGFLVQNCRPYGPKLKTLWFFPASAQLPTLTTAIEGMAYGQ